MMDRFAIFFLSVFAVSFYSAQQRMTLQECEKAFQENNLQLLAEQYNINIADAEVLQAKIWELPELNFQLNAYNPEAGKAFDMGQSKGAQITQLIYMGGKKKNEVAFAKSNKELAQLQFSQLLADLRMQLREAYYNLHYEEKKLESIDAQLHYMSDLLTAYQVQTGKGNISMKDAVRLQSIVIQLRNDKTEINNTITAYQQTLRTLTGIPPEILSLLPEDEAGTILAAQPFGNLDELKQKGTDHNADYLYHQKLIAHSRLYAQWQKSLNVPDLSIGAGWDQNGGTFRNEVNLIVGIPLPLWKSNKGNVEKAGYITQQSEKNAEYQKLSLESQIEAAYKTWKNFYDQYHQLQPADLENMGAVYEGMLKNFRNGNVNLIEFTDFTDSYRQTVLQVYEMKKQVLLSAENLNQLIQTKIFY